MGIRARFERRKTEQHRDWPLGLTKRCVNIRRGPVSHSWLQLYQSRTEAAVGLNPIAFKRLENPKRAIPS